MAKTGWGVDEEGRVVPSSPPPEISEELTAEFKAWDLMSADALELVECLARVVKAEGMR